MQQTGIPYRIISLLGMAAIVAIAWQMDQFLEFQRKYAAASFNYPQFAGLSIISRLVLMALWFGLGWLVLFKSGYSRLIWMTFLIVGLFWALVSYLFPFIPWHPVRNAILLTFQGSQAIVRSTGMFIAVLGLLNLALRSRWGISADGQYIKISPKIFLLIVMSFFALFVPGQRTTPAAAQDEVRYERIVYPISEGQVARSRNFYASDAPHWEKIAALPASLPIAVAPQNGNATTIAAGGGYTCAVTGSGGAKCWGINIFGQLGDGTATSRLTPVDVSGLSSGVAAISVGMSHTCALTDGGGVKCWGGNEDGELGDGTTTDRLTPVDVSGLSSGVAAISVGGSHTCALMDGGGVKCWGQNDSGQLGDGTTTNRLTPVDVSELGSGVIAIAAGQEHTCAVTSSGAARCWGQNIYGQLGDGTTIDRPTPVDVSGLSSGMEAITAGEGHTCALTSGGGVKCWGDNFFGQLGDGTTTSRLTPVNVSGLSSGVAAIAAGSSNSHTCAVTSGGGARCWGQNDAGQLGDGTTIGRLTPVGVSGLSSGVAAISVGAVHTCALMDGGGVKCWGDNGAGALGDCTATTRLTPVDVVGFGGAACSIPPCEVPYYSQRDPLWADHPLRTAGKCSTYCGKIGTCGCTLTSASMLFTYYGANLNPPTLSDAMGTWACPFYWYIADDYTNGEASFIGKYPFSYSRLEQELNQSNRPVILGMHKSGNSNNTHWVLVVSGEGNSASGYTVHDPWPLDGDYQNLSVLQRDNYVFDWISVYAGGPACNTISVVSNESRTINPIRVAVADDSADRSNVDQNESVSHLDYSPEITGTIYLYERTYLTMTLQISATSTLGDVTEMRVWTDTIPDTEWQPFAEFAGMEWYPEDEGIYVQFKDESGNISDVSKDTVRPIYSPPPETIDIYLPVTIKGN